jgi:hypothetical protein
MVVPDIVGLGGNAATMDPPAMPAVMLEAMPARSRATAKTTPEAPPSRGSSMDFACRSSSTGSRWLKNAAAARRIMALLMAHPTIIEKSVS